MALLEKAVNKSYSQTVRQAGTKLSRKFIGNVKTVFFFETTTGKLVLSPYSRTTLVNSNKLAKDQSFAITTISQSLYLHLP